jgi:hypothetical protein
VKAGDLVKEIVSDEAWRLYKDTVGVIVRPADDDMGLVSLDEIHHWLVAWGSGDVHIMHIDDVEVVNASR